MIDMFKIKILINQDYLLSLIPVNLLANVAILYTDRTVIENSSRVHSVHAAPEFYNLSKYETSVVQYMLYWVGTK